MAGTLPNGKYVVIPEAGHDLHLDDPDAWHTVAHAFLQRHRVGG
jgi:pimeloyl-ACP methyl ester carboxylesterase